MNLRTVLEDICIFKRLVIKEYILLLSELLYINLITKNIEFVN